MPRDFLLGIEVDVPGAAASWPSAGLIMNVLFCWNRKDSNKNDTRLNSCISQHPLISLSVTRINRKKMVNTTPWINFGTGSTKYFHDLNHLLFR